MAEPSSGADGRSIEPNAPLAIVCGGGSLPFAVANSALQAGRKVMLIALRNSADEKMVAKYPHHWIRLGQIARCIRLIRAANCRDVVLIGTVVRPTIAQLWPDLATMLLLPRVIGSFRGGDGHLLAGVARTFEDHGLKLVGAHEVAPEITLLSGPIGLSKPSDRSRSDIALGLALLRAIGPFDVGQAAVVADKRVLAVEAAEGTDQMLARLADLRGAGRVRWPEGSGVLIKAAKPGQDVRVDLPSLGPTTVDRVVAAGLAGIAAVAGTTLVAEPERVAAAADRAKIFVVGVNADGGTE
jgi:UDP-2,3-diacylglucosamine hydrolase